MSITYYSANKILDKTNGAVNFTEPSIWYVALSTTPISIDGTGATEPSGSGYARKDIPNNKTNWGTASNGKLSNLTSVQFAESSGSWGTITTVAIYDALTGGNIWYYGDLDTSRTVATSTTVLFDVAGIELEFVNS